MSGIYADPNTKSVGIGTTVDQVLLLFDTYFSKFVST